jgi:hypothetical protein
MKKRTKLGITISVCTISFSGLVIFNYYKVVESLNRPDCSSELSSSNINNFVNNLDRYIDLAEMSEYTYKRHGYEYLAAERNCNPDEYFSENSCNFSYMFSFFNGEFIYDKDTGLGYNIRKYTHTPIIEEVHGETEKQIDVAFKGTDSGKDVIDDIKQSLGLEVAQYQLRVPAANLVAQYLS